MTTSGYGIDHGTAAEYTHRLRAFCAKYGWEVHHNQKRICLHLLDDPSHRRQWWCSMPVIKDESWNLARTVLLRRGPAFMPEQWAILSQPDRAPVKTVIGDQDNPGFHGRVIGEAPFGHGTVAVLYAGKTRIEAMRAGAARRR